MRFAGGTQNIASQLNIEAFMKQAQEYRDLVSDGMMNKAIEHMRFSQATHPMNAVRALACQEWAGSDSYQMAKEYFDRFRNGLEPEYLPVHWTDKTFIGKDFKIAEKQLRECGFTNIITVAQDQRKLFDRDYGVVSIKIKEDADQKNGWIAPDTPILLKYTAPAQKQTH
jgi:hypothetical protein